MRKRIKELKEGIKKEEEFLEKCKEYGVGPDFIDDVPISFDDELDVSAKTVNGEVFLNGALFDANDWVDQMRYIQHEGTHILQQATGKVNEKTNKEDYLDDPNEIEAFQAQIAYMADHESPEELQKYLEQLLDHHNIQGKERKEKIKELTEEI
jgi:hypothetical protein